MSDIDAKAMLGRVVAERYRLDAIIAEGGMGAVYRGEHIHMRKRVAIKLLHPETKELPELVQRFERESIVGAHASHRNVASATDFGKDSDGTYYLIQEHIEGITLRSLLTRGPLEPSRALAIARDVALGLEAIHAIGIVHRDLAPKNVMVSETPPDTVKVIDFGFAKVPVERFANQGPAMALTSKGTVFGTIGFIAPEAAFGMAALGPKADLYALGVIMYEMLAGRHPFEHTDQ
jgi:serine/threonine-protein kinase